MSSTDYPTARDDRSRGSWGNPEPLTDEDDVEQDDDDDEGENEPTTELEVASSYLTDEQLARVEAVGVARTVLAVSGFLGAQPKLEPWALTYVAEWILKGPEQDAEGESSGTDAEPTDGQDVSTDGGKVETVTETMDRARLQPRPVRDNPQA